MSESKEDMKILLAMDDSKFSEAALQTVVKRYRRQDTEVKVLHVMEQVDLLSYPVGVSEDQERQAQELVDRAGQTLRTAGFKVDATVCRGEARSSIIDFAAEWQADLIVLGSHGHSGLERLLLGSVSDAILRHAPCSVEIVRLHSKP
jgi:nucleotide-binding universal stress UspA family protein